MSDPAGVRSMISIALLRPGPRWVLDQPLGDQDDVGQHFAYMDELAGAGTVTHGGPLHALDDLLKGDLVALVVFSVTADRAAELMQLDPTVRSGLMACDVLPWYQSL